MVECICALLVTTMVVLSINLVMTSVRKVNTSDLTGAIDWYLFLQELEAPSHRFELVDAHGHTLEMYSQRMSCKYEIKGYDCLYLSSKDGGGYLPILDGVRSFEYNFTKIDDQRVQVEVERNNGKKQVGIIRFYPSAVHEEP